MQRTSESIATLAAALAKAQIKLVNPEKTLLGTIPADAEGSSERVFRYASLASGLEIVRKVLGEHEIATVQTTAIDREAGLVNLTTVLAHASGEWIASDWPVCPVSATEVPHRMGAALTYARRYALFTLVGIAGEDDLDAPDLIAPGSAKEGSDNPKADRKSELNGGRNAARPGTSLPRHQTQTRPIATPKLDVEASAALRDRLIAAIAELRSSEDAALWAHRSLIEKDKLLVDEAKRVEDAFQTKLQALGVREDAPRPDSAVKPKRTHSRPSKSKTSKSRTAVGDRAIDKSALPFPEPRRIRDREHVKFVARHPCLVCGRSPSDAHHLRFAQSKAMGKKVSDEFTVPLCRGHHRQVHQSGNENAWWRNGRMDPVAAARALWLKSHPLPKIGQPPEPKSDHDPIESALPDSRRESRISRPQ